MANLFWVGGSNVYNGTTNRLATTSGGAASVAAIAAGDTVTFDGNSPAGATVTTSAAISCTTLTFAAGFTGSLTMSNGLTVAGVTTHTQGTLNTNGQTFTTNSFSGTGTAVRSLTLGASTVNCATGNWNYSGTNSTLSAASSTLNIQGNGVTLQGDNSDTYGTVVFTGSGTKTINGSLNYTTLTVTGTANKNDIVSLTANQTVSGTLTLTANSNVNRIRVQSNTTATARTLTAATLVATNTIEFMDITGAGAATWTTGASGASAFGDCGGNSGITFTGASTQTATGTGNFTWSTHGWTTRVPLPQDNVVINNAFSGGNTITQDMQTMGKDIDMSGGSGTVTLNITAQAADIFGSFSRRSGVASNGSPNLFFRGRSSHTITTSGVTASGWNIQVVAPGGTYTLVDGLTSANAFSVGFGTFDTAAQSFSVRDFTASGSATVTITNSTVTLTGTTQTTPWNVASGNTVNAGGSTIIFSSSASATARTFAGGGKTYGTLTYTVAGSTGSMTLTSSNTFATINFSDVTNARTLLFTAGTTTTISTGFNVNGTSGKLMTIGSVTAASHTIAMPTGISCDFLSISRSTLTGNSAYAGANSTDGGNNSTAPGWIFSAPPAGGRSNQYLTMMGVG